MSLVNLGLLGLIATRTLDTPPNHGEIVTSSLLNLVEPQPALNVHLHRHRLLPPIMLGRK